MTEIEQLKTQIEILRAQRNGALDEAVSARTQAQVAIRAMMTKDEENAVLKARVADLETAKETPSPKIGSKAHLNEAGSNGTRFDAGFNGH